MDIYVGNLSYDLTAEELREAFEQHGEVTNAKIVMDRDTGRSKGFGFVEMPNQAEGAAARRLSLRARLRCSTTLLMANAPVIATAASATMAAPTTPLWRAVHRRTRVKVE